MKLMRRSPKTCRPSKVMVTSAADVDCDTVFLKNRFVFLHQRYECEVFVPCPRFLVVVALAEPTQYRWPAFAKYNSDDYHVTQDSTLTFRADDAFEKVYGRERKNLRYGRRIRRWSERYRIVNEKDSA